jgi:acylglycerol lipase
VSKNSRPHILVEYVARAIVYFAGMLPLAKAVRGEFGRLTVVSRWRGCRLAYHSGNVLCYHGWLRVGTGLSLLEGMIELDKRAEEINVRKSVGAFHQPVRHNLDL